MTDVELKLPLDGGWTLVRATLRPGSVITLLHFHHTHDGEVYARFDLGKQAILDRAPVKVAPNTLAEVADKLARRNDTERAARAHY